MTAIRGTIEHWNDWVWESVVSELQEQKNRNAPLWYVFDACTWWSGVEWFHLHFYFVDINSIVDSNVGQFSLTSDDEYFARFLLPRWTLAATVRFRIKCTFRRSTCTRDWESWHNAIRNCRLVVWKQSKNTERVVVARKLSENNSDSGLNLFQLRFQLVVNLLDIKSTEHKRSYPHRFSKVGEN